jgi:hypothetical protein
MSGGEIEKVGGGRRGDVDWLAGTLLRIVIELDWKSRGRA